MGKDKENKRIAESKMRYNQFVTSKSLARKGGTRGITLIALVITTIFSYDEKLKSSNNNGFLLQTI